MISIKEKTPYNPSAYSPRRCTRPKSGDRREKRQAAGQRLPSRSRRTITGSLHKRPFAIMRYSCSPTCRMCGATTAQRTQKDFYVKTRPTTERSGCRRAAGEGRTIYKHDPENRGTRTEGHSGHPVGSSYLIKFIFCKTL